MDLSSDPSLMEDYPDSFTFVNSAGDSTPDILGRAFPVNTEMAEPTGVCVRNQMSIRISSDQVIDPHEGDTFVDGGGTSWFVEGVSELRFGGGWFISLVNLAINAATADHINVLAPAFTTDQWADNVNTPTPAFTNVPCRIIPIGSGIGEIGSKKGMIRAYDIYLLVDMDLDFGAVIANVDTDDTQVYIVEAITGRLSLRDFTVIRCNVYP